VWKWHLVTHCVNYNGKWNTAVVKYVFSYFSCVVVSFTSSTLLIQTLPNSCSKLYCITKKSCFYSGTAGKYWRGSGLHVGTSAAETDLQTGWNLMHQTWGLHCWVQFKLQVYEIKILNRLLLFVRGGTQKNRIFFKKEDLFTFRTKIT